MEKFYAVFITLVLYKETPEINYAHHQTMVVNGFQMDTLEAHGTFDLTPRQQHYIMKQMAKLMVKGGQQSIKRSDNFTEVVVKYYKEF